VSPLSSSSSSSSEPASAAALPFFDEGAFIPAVVFAFLLADAGEASLDGALRARLDAVGDASTSALSSSSLPDSSSSSSSSSLSSFFLAPLRLEVVALRDPRLEVLLADDGVEALFFFDDALAAGEGPGLLRSAFVGFGYVEMKRDDDQRVNTAVSRCRKLESGGNRGKTLVTSACLLEI